MKAVATCLKSTILNCYPTLDSIAAKLERIMDSIDALEVALANGDNQRKSEILVELRTLVTNQLLEQSLSEARKEIEVKCSAYMPISNIIIRGLKYITKSYLLQLSDQENVR